MALCLCGLKYPSSLCGDCHHANQQTILRSLPHFKLFFWKKEQLSCGNRPDHELNVNAAESGQILLWRADRDPHIQLLFFVCVCEFLKKLCSKYHFSDLFYHTQTWRFSVCYEEKPPAQLHFGKWHFVKVQLFPEVVLRATNHAFGTSLNLESSIMHPAVACWDNFYTFSVLHGNLLSVIHGCRKYLCVSSARNLESWNGLGRKRP